MRCLIAVMAWIPVLLTTGADQVFSQDTWNMELIGRAAYDGSFLNFAVNGEYSYVAASTGTFSVVDLSDPGRPHRIGTVAEGILVWDFLTVDTLLYVSIHPGQVIIYNISDPSWPVELAFIEQDLGFGNLIKLYNGYIGSVKVLDGYFYVISIADPLVPQEAAVIAVDHPVTDFEFSGNYLLLVERDPLDGYYYFEIYDMGDIDNPQLIYSSQLGYASYYLRLDVVGDYAYIYYGVSGIQIYDLRNIPEVDLVNTAFEGEGIVDTRVHGNILFAVKNPNSLLTLDVSDPVNPTITNECICYPRSLSILENLIVSDDILYFVAESQALSFYDVSDPDSPSVLGRYVTDTQNANVARWGDFAYTGSAGLRIFDIGDPTDPVGLDWYYLPDETRYCLASNGLLFVVNMNNVIIYSLSDPRHPDSLSTVYTDNIVHRVYADDPFLYIANDGDGFSIVDTSDPLNPVEVGRFPSEHPFNYYRSIFAYEDYAYTAEADSGVGIYNIADPSYPVKAAAYDDAPNPTCVFYSDGMVYVTDHYEGLLILDVTDPANPLLRGTYEFDQAYDIFVAGDTAYVAARRYGLMVFDVSNPFAPQLIGGFEDPGYCWGVTVENDTVFALSTNAGGLNILRYDETVGVRDLFEKPESFRLAQSYPNPFNATTTLDYSLPESAEVILSIYDILGRRVDTLFEGKRDAGKYTVTWDASEFPSGVYFARLEAGESTETIKMVLLK